MANVSSLMNSSSSATSLYGSRNVLSGLASGMDTESMIANSVEGYKTKISDLEKSQTKVQWKQEAYREIIGIASDMSKKYGSYTSSTNLMSASFFDNVSIAAATGDYASAVSATGNTKSTVEIHQIEKLATSATYVTRAKNSNHTPAVQNNTLRVNLSANETRIAQNAGTLTLSYNSIDYQIEFGKDDWKDNYADMKELVERKLAALTQSVETSQGTLNAEEAFQLQPDGTIEAIDPYLDTDGVHYTRPVTLSFTPSGDAQKAGRDEDPSYTLLYGTQTINKTIDKLQGKTLSLTLDGQERRITLGGIADAEDPYAMDATKLASYLQKEINRAFSATDNPVNITAKSDGSLEFSFSEDGDHSLKINASDADVKNILGLGDSGVEITSAASADNLSSILGRNTVGTLSINGVSITHELTGESTIDDVMTAINNRSSETGVTVSYSKINGEFTFKTTETGAAQEIQLGGDLALLFNDENAVSTKGTDAIVHLTVNGKQSTISHSSNTIDVDGLKIKLKEETPKDLPLNKSAAEGGVPDAKIKFGGSANDDTVVNAVKSFVEDYNKLLNSLHKSYTTQPEKTSKGGSYEPLTESEKSSMSEYYIKSHEESAKTGLLFADSDLSSMYSKLVRVFSNGALRADMEKIGLSTTFNNGVTTLTLDEKKLRASLEDGTDQVKKVFNESSVGAKDGLVAQMKSTLDMYASTSSGSPGILVSKAGTTLSPYSLTNNRLQKQIDSIQEQIERWQTKVSNRIDYYTRQFTKLEQLINTMNSQSSALAGMMGG